MAHAQGWKNNLKKDIEHNPYYLETNPRHHIISILNISIHILQDKDFLKANITPMLSSNLKRINSHPLTSSNSQI